MGVIGAKPIQSAVLAPVDIFERLMKKEIPAVANFLAVVTITLASVSVCFGQVSLKMQGNDRVAITINGQPFSDFYVGAEYPKPFLWPLRSVGGQVVTRRFPMEKVAGETTDHPHHRGLWIGFHDVNGFNFWENEFNQPGENRGKIVIVGTPKLAQRGKHATITAVFEWRDPTGRDILDEQRVMTIYGQPSDRRVIDIDSTFTAKVNLKFADEKDGFFAIRLADTMTEKSGGLISNADGAHTEKNVWGKPSNWVDYDGTVEGHKLGIAIFDHPANSNHPVRWHVRAYGLFAANPFALRAFNPQAAEQGGFNLGGSDQMRFRYRVIVHDGDVPNKRLNTWYSDYKKSVK